ncbi:hypothetical protein FOL47_006816 [Perkinsus chesapeaki]|uniref:Uncharacterized protein n=1 Tax=Perkinsus chesapeaki TaxID=330153 RepID=A0A7J6MX46_PERCH|nr:hypothetical protein FOL47_006816 [Perkinsus chesapeaki]
MSSPSHRTWEACKAQAREVEHSIEGGIAELGRLSGNAERRGSTRIGIDDQIEDESSSDVALCGQIVTTLRSSTERHLTTLEDIVNEMAKMAEDKSRRAQLQRHRGILTWEPAFCFRWTLSCHDDLALPARLLPGSAVTQIIAHAHAQRAADVTESELRAMKLPPEVRQEYLDVIQKLRDLGNLSI